MQLNRVSLRNVRIVEEAGFEPGPSFNYVVGSNGSGKTSLLEGLHILSCGSSFLTKQLNSVIRHDQVSLLATADYTDPEDNSAHHAGVERGRDGSSRIRVDREDVARMSDLSRNLPVIALQPESHQLLGGGPSERRKLLDWGVFHVEHQFMEAWRDYRRSLAQRNATLKAGGDREAIRLWDPGLAASGERLTAYREAYLEQLAPILAQALASVEFGREVAVELQRGWNQQYALAEALDRSRQRDLQYRTTTVGPHRAELHIRSEGHEIRRVFSRGQQKLFIYVLRLAQAELLRTQGGKRCLFLCDDLPAELDRENCARVVSLLGEAGYQVFASSVSTPESSLLGTEGRVFHVEHGKLGQVV